MITTNTRPSKTAGRRVKASFLSAITLGMIGLASTAQAGLDDYKNPGYFDDFNPSPNDFNTTGWQVGFDSGGNDNPNALQWSATLEVEETYLYDNYGNKLTKDGDIVETKAGRIGYYGNGEHFGKVHAGAWTQIKINGVTRDCIYLAAAPIQGGGTYSGWARVDRMNEESKLRTYSQQIHNRRESSSVRYTANPGGSSRYVKHTVINASVPSAMEDGYILPNRTSNAGKSTYYYIRDGVLNGFINLPETGNKRHGVQSSRVRVGGNFWRDLDVDNYIQDIYGYNSSSIVGTFRWCFGYFETNTGDKIYCWTNLECLDSGPLVMLRKRNATGYTINGGSGASNGKNVTLYSYIKGHQNLTWEEIDRGGGYYSYQKKGTHYSLDGGSGGKNNQNITLRETRGSDYDQHWKKVSKGNGYFQLQKRNSLGYCINGGSGGKNHQNVNLYNSSNSSHNLQWSIEYQ